MAVVVVRHQHDMAVGFDHDFAYPAVIDIRVSPGLRRDHQCAHHKVAHDVAMTNDDIVAVLAARRHKILLPGLPGLLETLFDLPNAGIVAPQPHPRRYFRWNGDAASIDVHVGLMPFDGKIRHGGYKLPEQRRWSDWNIRKFERNEPRAFHCSCQR